MAKNTTAPGWYSDGQGAERWWDGKRWTSKVRDASGPHSTSSEVAVVGRRTQELVSPSSIDAGWHDDPDRPGFVRYHDGTRWTEHQQLARGKMLDNYLGLYLYENEVWSGSTGGPLIGVKAEVATQGQITQRVTATRLVALGVFALAVPKSSGNQVVVLHVEAPTFELIHPVQSRGGTTEWGHLARIAQYINDRRHALAHLKTVPAQPMVVVGQELSIADELVKLADLRDRGILTDEEFAMQKVSLLRSGR